MGNSEEATMPDDLPFSPEDLMFEGEDDGMEGYAAGGFIKAQQGAFVPNPMTGIGGYQPSMFNDGSMNIAPATMATPSGTVPSNATGTATGYLPSFVNQPVPSTVAPVTSTTTTGTTGTAPAPTTPADTPFVPEVGNVYTFKKYINPTTGEIRDFPFYYNDPVIPIPDGFIPYDATAQAEQQPTDVGVQTTQMLQDEGDNDDDEPMPTFEPIDYSKMNADEILQAYKNNQTASSIMMGIGAAFPPVALFGAWATNRERNKIVERMDELGLEVPKGGIINNIVNGITNLFTGKKEEPAATATRTTGGRRASSGDEGASADVTPVSTTKAASAPVEGGRGTGATPEYGKTKATVRNVTALEGPEATKDDDEGANAVVTPISVNRDAGASASKSGLSSKSGTGAGVAATSSGSRTASAGASGAGAPGKAGSEIGAGPGGKNATGPMAKGGLAARRK